MKIEVTQKHIDEGLDYMGTADHCVVARAIQAVSNHPWNYVGVTSANVGGEKLYFARRSKSIYKTVCPLRQSSAHFSRSMDIRG